MSAGLRDTACAGIAIPKQSTTLLAKEASFLIIPQEQFHISKLTKHV